MKRIVISDDPVTHASRIAAILKADVKPASWMRLGGGEPLSLIVDSADVYRLPPLVEGARFTLLDTGGGGDVKWCACGVIDPEMSAEHIRAVVDISESERTAGMAPFRGFDEQWSSLTEREREVVVERCFGMTAKESAAKSGLSRRTIETLMLRARRRLDFFYAPRFVGLLVREGIIEAPAGRGRWLKAWRSLTDRQREVARMSMMFPDREVGARLEISPRTVEEHRRKVMATVRGDVGAYNYSAIHLARDAAWAGVHPEVERSL